MLNIRLSKEDSELALNYAKEKGIELSDVIRTLMIEKEEDRKDYATIIDYLERKADGDVEYYTYEEMLEELKK